jgi:hypothetical protein
MPSGALLGAGEQVTSSLFNIPIEKRMEDPCKFNQRRNNCMVSIKYNCVNNCVKNCEQILRYRCINVFFENWFDIDLLLHLAGHCR